MLGSSVQSGAYYNMYVYLCSVCNINIRFQFCYQLYQRTPIVTCKRRISYYAYHTCQSESYVIKINRKDIVHALGGFRTYLEPRPNHLALNQILPQGSQ